MNTVFAGRASLAYISLWVPNSEGWNPKWESRFNELYGYNPEKAKQLLKEAGYGPGQLKFKIWAFTEPGESEGPAIADALAHLLAERRRQRRGPDARLVQDPHDVPQEGEPQLMWPNIIGWRPADQGVRNFYITARATTTTSRTTSSRRPSTRCRSRRTPSAAQQADAVDRRPHPGGVRRHPALLVPQRGFRQSEGRRQLGLPGPRCRPLVAFRARSSSSSKRNAAARESNASPCGGRLMIHEPSKEGRQHAARSHEECAG